MLMIDDQTTNHALFGMMIFMFDIHTFKWEKLLQFGVLGCYLKHEGKLMLMSKWCANSKSTIDQHAAISQTMRLHERNILYLD